MFFNPATTPLPTKEVFMASVASLTNETLPQMYRLYQIGSIHIDETALIYNTFGIESYCKPAVEHFSGQAFASDALLQASIKDYRAAMKKIVEHIESIKTHNRQLSTNIDFPTAILACMRTDDITKFTTLMQQLDLLPGSAHPGYALRAAAADDAFKCLGFLLRYRTNMITEAGPTSGRIALHWAITKSSARCVKALLNAVNAMDYYDPAGQLLFGDKPNRPIDQIVKIQDEAKKVEVIATITHAVNGKPGQECSAEQRQEIRETLLAAVAPTPASTSSQPSFMPR